MLGWAVGDCEGLELGLWVGVLVGVEEVGAIVGDAVGSEVVGEVVGAKVGFEVVGDVVGAEVLGRSVGDVVGEAVGGPARSPPPHAQQRALELNEFCPTLPQRWESSHVIGRAEDTRLPAQQARRSAGQVWRRSARGRLLDVKLEASHALHCGQGT